MDRKQVNVRLSSDILKLIDEKGCRSDIIRKALDFYFSEEKRITLLYGLIDKKLDCLIEDVGEIKRFQPVINLNVPDKLLSAVSSDTKKGFWNKLFKH